MRIVSIIVALLAGLASLLVSVCGGGFLIQFGYTAIHSLLHPAPMQHQTGVQIALRILPMLVFAAACAVGGGVVCWLCIRFIRREWRGRD